MVHLGDVDYNVSSSELSLQSFIQSNLSAPINKTCCMCQKQEESVMDENHSYDAFVYIIVVLSFYAMSMVLLMIKYIRREEEEISLDFYYTEFVKREKFQSANFRNNLALEKVNSIAVLKRNEEKFAELEITGDATNCKIEITPPSEDTRDFSFEEVSSQDVQLTDKQLNSSSSLISNIVDVSDDYFLETKV